MQGTETATEKGQRHCFHGIRLGRKKEPTFHCLGAMKTATF